MGLKAQPVEKIMLQFELGNDWYGTEVVNVLAGDFYKVRNPLTPYFSLAYAKWDPGAFNLTMGLQPVKGSAVMDLVAMSLYWNTVIGINSYMMASHIPWGVITNFSIPGVKIGAPLLKDNFKLAAELFTTVVEERPVTPAVEDAFQKNPSAVMLKLDLPLAVGSLTATPQLVLVTNRIARDDSVVEAASDMEMTFGANLNYKLNDNISFRAGFGMASLSNANTWDDSDTALGLSKMAQSGMNVTLGTSVKAGPGKADLDFNFSTNDNTEIDDDKVTYMFVDAKYGIPLDKKFIVMPRVRVFLSNPEVDDSSARTLWPELMLIGVF